MQRIAACIVPALVCVAVLAAPAKTFRLTGAMLDPAVREYLQGVTHAKPDDAGAMPEFESADVRFVDVCLGENKPMLLAVDMRGEGDAAVPIMYLDIDADRDLTDETPLETTSAGLPDGGRGAPATAEITIPVTYRLSGGEEVRREFRFRLATISVHNSYPVLLVNHCRRGRIELGGKQVLITLTDGDGDAAYGAKTSWPGDRIWLDRNGDGKKERAEETVLTRYIESEGKFYRLQPEPDGSRISVTPYEGEPCEVSFEATDGKGRPMKATSLTLYGADLFVTTPWIVERVALPPGDYRLRYGVVESEGATPTYNFASNDVLTLKPGQHTRIQCGGELELDLSVKQLSLTADGLHLRVSVNPRTIAAGHGFWGPSPVRDWTPGKLEVLDSDGEVVATEGAPYAGDGVWPCTVRVPEVKTGDVLTVKVTWSCEDYQDDLIKEIEHTVQ